ncbi:hypothetical protein Rcae01_02178 [Novipirellula caenicola]|uniref:Uncharacterized protein n=2 Tax=Novipirellula caenicola TaxID=1536901 RepID=A0ABP9VQ23_9BACT
MNDAFVKSQWQILCDDLRRCADAIAVSEADAKEFARQSETFANQEPPERYPDLLKRTAEAAELAVQWQQRRDDQLAAGNDSAQNKQARDQVSRSEPARDATARDATARDATARDEVSRFGTADERATHEHEEAMIDEASDESFPASDPPSFSHAHA